MSTDFKLYVEDEKELYKNKTKEEKQEILRDMVMMAIDRGIKPAARYYKTSPKTVRTWVNKYKEKGEDALKYKI